MCDSLLALTQRPLVSGDAFECLTLICCSTEVLRDASYQRFTFAVKLVLTLYNAAPQAGIPRRRRTVRVKSPAVATTVLQVLEL